MPKSPVSKVTRVSNPIGSVNPKLNSKSDNGSKQAKDRSDAHARLENVQFRLAGLCDRFRCSAIVFDIAYQLFTTSERFRFFALNAPLGPIAVACLLEASRRGLEGLAFDDPSICTGFDKKVLGKIHRKLTTKINKQTEADDTFEACMTLHGPREPTEVLYVKRYARTLHLPQRTVRLATLITQTMHSETVSNPTSVAACAILFAAAVEGEKEDSLELSAFSNTSMMQLRIGFDRLRHLEGDGREKLLDGVEALYEVDRLAASIKLHALKSLGFA
ncbi:hypothetical protein FRB95_007466 [Tulasnella sp. JGI-2019a]|nr:hypothetical protein FRB95_007466 [Tulasnella sp. JGI-2019a]